MAEEVHSGTEAAEAIGRLMDCPGRLQAMQEACRRFDHAKAAQDVILLGETLCKPI